MRLTPNDNSHAEQEQLMLIGIPIYEKVDLLDVAAPYEIFNLWGSDSPKLASLALKVLVSGL